MATRTCEFFFDFGSPTSYLAWTQLPGICADAGAKLVFRPMLLGGVFQATGNASPVSVPAKGKYMLVDMTRFARRYGVRMTFNPHFPINTLTLMRAAVGVLGAMPDRFADFVRTIYEAMWIEARNMGDAAVAGEVIARAGYDARDIVDLASAPDTKAALKANTDEALSRGAFGAPTMFVGSEKFFGQDRLDFVKEALSER